MKSIESKARFQGKSGNDKIDQAGVEALKRRDLIVIMESILESIGVGSTNTHRLHVWCLCLHVGDFLRANIPAPWSIDITSCNRTSPINGGFHRKITDFYDQFSIAMLDYRRVI